MSNTLTNPDKVVTAEMLQEYHESILPYLGGMPSMVANKFDKGNLYSTDERMIGQWIDGKPLYQKTFSGLSIALATNSGTAYSGSVGALITGIKPIKCQISGVNSNYATCEDATIWAKGDTWFLYANNNMTINELTVQYTKTTDSAIAIGNDTDYSTTEKIVGTWIDGKPLYQRVYTNLSISLKGAVWYDTEIDSTNCNPVNGCCYAGNADNYIVPLCIRSHQNTWKLLYPINMSTITSFIVQYIKTTD